MRSRPSIRRLAAVRDNEHRLKPGLELFRMDDPDTKELQWTDTEAATLKKMWTETSQWQEQWKSWKGNGVCRARHQRHGAHRSAVYQTRGQARERAWHAGRGERCKEDAPLIRL